ncbi:arginine--tRNA ligase [Thermopetrobacter sp. TC1]|uniref:arginine--tRNA ligase n=1 Tax=Thermopetrobacter sp. TC1 TaxID=1495045 RepID=UPI000570A005|nr:arginine--tRNA ligase [Thermopetrobacter sp. TC1]
MNLFHHVRQKVEAALRTLQQEGLLPADAPLDRITVEPPRDPAHGDVTTNAAMVLARAAGMKPRDLAGKLAALLRAEPDFKEVEIAGPGFINMRLSDAFWPQLLDAVLAEGEAYGRSDIGRSEKVNVEYVSANPTGPLHVGHTRGAVFGDALANLLEETGHDVTREYYINDAGAQVDVLARSVFLRYREALGEDIGEIPAGLYPGDYLKPVGAALAEKYGRSLLEKPEEEWLPLVRDFAVERMMALIREDLAALGIEHEVFFSERTLHESGLIDETIRELEKRGLVYVGRLPPPKGKPPEDWEDREQLLFRSSDFGDDIDRPLKKSDGSYTYFAADVAYIRNKLERGFTQLVYVLGADHGGYVKRLEAVNKALSGGSARLIARLCQLVKLYRGGEPVKMSKRAGDFVTLRQVVDEVGPDVVRFMMLTRRNDAPLDFDFEKVTEQSRDNPVFYVQYAHARICSVLRNASEELGAEAQGDVDFSLLSDEAERQLIRRIGEYPRMLEQAARAHEPHRVAFYLQDLAAEFHALWNKGKEKPELRFIMPENPLLSRTRLAFLRAIRYCLANGLRILGVRPVEKM